MMSIIYILGCLAALAVISLLLATFVPADRIRELLARFLTIALGPFELLREGSLAVISKAWQLMQTAARSVGIAGEHWVQRLVGALMLTALSGVCFFVDYLLARETINGLFGGTSQAPLVGLSLEAMGAISLVTSLIIWGALLLDTLGMTHITIFSGDKYNQWLRRSVTVLAGFGFLLTAYLFAQLGGIRYDILQGDSGPAPSASMLQVPQAVAAPINSPEEMAEQIYESRQPDNQVLTMDQFQPEVSAGHISRMPRSARAILVGMPISSSMAGLFSAVAIVPAMGMVITFPIFLTVAVIFGLFYVLAQAGNRLVNLIYNFLLMFANMFIDLGGRMGTRRQSGQVPPPSAPSEPAPEPAPIPEPAPAQDAAPQPVDPTPVPPPPPIYEKNDIIFNPLTGNNEV